MHAWIGEEKWVAAGQPALSEQHSLLVDGEGNMAIVYGRLLSPDEERVVSQALRNWRFYGEGVELPTT